MKFAIQATIALLGLLSSLTAARAAYLWLRASRIGIDPRGGEQSGEHQIRQDAWIFAVMQAYTQSSALNSSAARWSAAAAALSAMTALVAAVMLML